MTTLTIDMTSDATIAAAVTAMSTGDRHKLTQALRSADTVDNTAAILDEIRATLLGEFPEAYNKGDIVGVQFATMEYDNGHYLHEAGTVLFLDGDTDEVEFGIGDELTDEYGCVGSAHTLTIDLRTNTFTEDEYSDDGIHAVLGIAKLPEPVNPADAALIGALLHGNHEDGMRDRKMRHLATITVQQQQQQQHRVAVLVPADDAPDLVCMSCAMVGRATNGDTSDAALLRWHA